MSKAFELPENVDVYQEEFPPPLTHTHARTHTHTHYYHFAECVKWNWSGGHFCNGNGDLFKKQKVPQEEHLPKKKKSSYFSCL